MTTLKEAKWIAIAEPQPHPSIRDGRQQCNACSTNGDINSKLVATMSTCAVRFCSVPLLAFAIFTRINGRKKTEQAVATPLAADSGSALSCATTQETSSPRVL